MMDQNRKIKIALATLGCKVNQYESAGIIRKLTTKGFESVPFNCPADIYIVNTCTVTEKTDYQSRQLIKRANRTNPEAVIIATGCYAQTAPEKLSNLPGVTLVAGSDLKERLPGIIEAAMSSTKEKPTWEEFSLKTLPGMGFDYDPDTNLPDHTRAFLKIQDGCNSFCSYCIVPYARGRSRSLDADQVIHRVSALVASGYKEIVLSGIHLGMYGLDFDKHCSLLELLNRIEMNVEGLSRIRLSSIEPTEVTEELIGYVAQSRTICHHFHIPLQSGSNKILTRMKRCYSNQAFGEVVRKIKIALPDAAIGIDVMAGFPGEDESDFTDTVEFIKGLPIAYLHVFPYSRRPGTEAARYPDQVNERIKKERARVLRLLGQEKRRFFNDFFIGRKLSVLIESEHDRETGLRKGFSNNYIPVLIEGNPAAISGNKIVDVIVTRSSDNKLYGLIEDGNQNQPAERA
jgi:threonylcarbamoyladenosine tRNA methylthiotransferase MtaB